MKKLFRNPPHTLVILMITLVVLILGNHVWCASLSGVVLDIDGIPAQGKAVAAVLFDVLSDDIDAAVNTNAFMCSSDEVGAFCFTNLPHGVYEIFVLPSGVLKTNNLLYPTIKIELFSDVVSNLVIRPSVISRFNLHGQISSHKTGTPIKAEIKVVSMSPDIALTEPLAYLELSKPVQADESGLFLKQNLPSGRYFLEINTLPAIEITITDQGEVLIADFLKAALAQADINLTLKVDRGQR